MYSVVQECSYPMLNVKKILECANSNLGNKLFYSMGNYISNLKQKINYVPWIMINGVYTDQIQQEAEFNLLNFLCQKFRILNNQTNIYRC
jgi:hypothetical protein